MHVRPVTPADHDEWVRLRLALWPDCGPNLPAEVGDYHDKGVIGNLRTMVLVADHGDGRLGGFVEASLRPIAAGCRTSPVGYIEGWYVDPDLRQRGVGRELVEAAIDWARRQGCSEIASDFEDGNEPSRRAHAALGFQPATREVAVFRPDSGKPGNQHASAIGLLPFRLNSGVAVRFVTDEAAGGIALFAGTTRAEQGPDGRRLLALDYEAYPEMAQRQLQDLAAGARRRWPILRLVLLHRTGRVALGEASVLIAVSTPHRGEAFEACRWLIDTLKADLAVWKKEIWEEGEETWAPPNKEWRGGE